MPERLTPLLRALDIALASLLIFFGWTALEIGLFFNALFLFMLLALPVRIGRILWNLGRRSLELRLVREPRARDLWLYWVQFSNAALFWLCAAITIETCVIPAQFSAAENRMLRGMVWGTAGLLIVLRLLPGKRVFVASQAAFTLGWIFIVKEQIQLRWPGSKSEAVELAAPFHGEWIVVQGGRSSLINHHYRVPSQRDALDLAGLSNGQVRIGKERALEAYPAWGQTLLAPADGKVVAVVSNLRDNAIGETDHEHLAGNHVCIDLGNRRYVLMAHLQKDSVLVAVGDTVHAGQPVAKCGNSGNTSQPHLHLQVQSEPNLFTPGARTYPIVFREVKCLRDGQPQTDAAPWEVRRNDRVIAE